MATQTTFMILASQLLYGVPMLLVCVGGIVFAARYWRRWPRPAMLAVTGLALMLFASVAGAAAQAYFIGSAGPGGMGAVALRMQVIGFAFTMVRAVGLGLLVAAVFAARPREAAPAGFDLNRAGEPPLANFAPPASTAPSATV